MEIVTTPAVHFLYEGHDGDKVHKSADITSAVIYGLVCVLGVTGNGAVIWATTGSRMERTVSTVWYLNLAVADFLVTACLPLEIAYNALDWHWPFGRSMCKMDAMVFFTNMYASIYTLTVISVDRCVGVVCPMWARCSGHRTIRKAYWVCLGVWVLALALSSPYFAFKDTRPVGDDKVLCDDNYALVNDWHNLTREEEQLDKFRFRALVITDFVAGFVVPLSAIVSCYSVIIYRLGNNRPLTATQPGRRSFKIIAAVIGAFFLCWLPYHVTWLIDLYVLTAGLESSDTLHLVQPITYALALLNSCLNPLLYVFPGQGFKDVFHSRSILKVLEKAFAEEPPQTNNNNSPTDPAVTRPETVLSETLV